MMESTVENFVLDASYFSQILGGQKFSENLRNKIAQSDLRYRTLSRAERDVVILGILKRIDLGKLDLG